MSFLVLYLVQVELRVQHALHASISMQANEKSKSNVKVSTPNEPFEERGMSSLHLFRFSRPKMLKTERMCCFLRYRFNISKNTNEGFQPVAWETFRPNARRVPGAFCAEFHFSTVGRSLKP